MTKWLEDFSTKILLFLSNGIKSKFEEETKKLEIKEEISLIYENASPRSELRFIFMDATEEEKDAINIVKSFTFILCRGEWVACIMNIYEEYRVNRLIFFFFLFFNSVLYVS